MTTLESFSTSLSDRLMFLMSWIFSFIPSTLDDAGLAALPISASDHPAVWATYHELVRVILEALEERLDGFVFALPLLSRELALPELMLEVALLFRDLNSSELASQ